MWLAPFLTMQLICYAAGPPGSHGGEHVAFLLEWEDVDPSLHLYPPTLVLAETRSLNVSIPDGPTGKTRLEVASLSVVLGNGIQCEVPGLGPSTFVLPPLAGRQLEYRLTVYTAGYAAATVYPEGSSNLVDPAMANPFAKPALLRAEGYSVGTHFNAVDTILESRFDAGRQRVFVVPMRKLPLRKPLDRQSYRGPSHRKPGSTYDDVYTFYSQVASLEQAISGGHLEKSRHEERRVLSDAICQEYESLLSMLAEPDGMVRATKPLYERVEAWGRMPVPTSRPSQDRPTRPGPRR